MQRVTFLIYNKRLLLFVLLGALSGGARGQSILIFSLTFFYERGLFGFSGFTLKLIFADYPCFDINP